MLAARFLRRTTVKKNKEKDDAQPEVEEKHVAPVEGNTEVHSLAEFQNEHTHSASKGRGFYHWVEVVYLAMLRFSLQYRWVVVLVVLGLICAIPVLLKHVRKNFIPDDDQSEFLITLRAPEGTGIEATQLIAKKIAREVRALNGVEYIPLRAWPIPTSILPTWAIFMCALWIWTSVRLGSWNL